MNVYTSDTILSNGSFNGHNLFQFPFNWADDWTADWSWSLTRIYIELRGFVLYLGARCSNVL